MPPTIASVLAGGPLDPVDARALLRHALKADDAYLVAHREAVLSAGQMSAFAASAARRQAGEPVAYIVGKREFFSIEFAVCPAVLIPRPETELLVETVLQNIPDSAASHVIDLGTGSGCIAITIAIHRPRARVTGVDRSTEALQVAAANALRLHTGNVEFKQSDWFAALAGESFDVIVSNPPYIAEGDPHLASGDLRAEPIDALVGGGDGLDCIRSIVAAASRHLRPGGLLGFEHGYDQAPAVRELLKRAGFEGVFTCKDLAGIERVSGGYRAK
jgi:release factor glutamine methyltransferase